MPFISPQKSGFQNFLVQKDKFRFIQALAMFEQKTRRLLHMLQPCEASQYGLHISDFCHKSRLLYQTTITCTSLHSIYLMNLELAFSFLDLSTNERKNLSQS